MSGWNESRMNGPVPISCLPGSIVPAMISLGVIQKWLGLAVRPLNGPYGFTSLNTTVRGWGGVGLELEQAAGDEAVQRLRQEGGVLVGVQRRVPADAQAERAARLRLPLRRHLGGRDHRRLFDGARATRIALLVAATAGREEG